MTKDGVCYMTHDHTLDRTTNGTGVFETKTAAEIDALRTKKATKSCVWTNLHASLTEKIIFM
jgi:glycerophosphoryl diester phosphodiesterase